MYKKSLLIFLGFLLLVGCNDRLVENAEEIEKQKEEKELDTELLKEKQLKVLEENEVTPEQAIKEREGEREVKETLETKEVEEIESFEDKEEFAQYTARILFEYFTTELSPEQYYDFIINHGSRLMLEDIDPANKENIIKGYANVQSQLVKNGTTFTDYKISEVTVDETGIYAYFYRTLLTDDDEEVNYITTIVKESDGWKFDADDLSQGYIEERKEG